VDDARYFHIIIIVRNVGVRWQYGQVVVLHKVVINFIRIRQVTPNCLTAHPWRSLLSTIASLLSKKHHKNSLHIRRLLVSKKTTSGKIQLCCVKLNRVSLFFCEGVSYSATCRTSSDL